MIEVTQQARDAAFAFLQTAVVIDDEAFMSAGAPSGAVEALPPSESAEAGEAGDLEQLQAPGDELEPGGALDAEKLIEGFAALGLVCAVLRPAAGVDDVPLAEKAFKRADILILDWEIFRDDGVRALKLIRQVSRNRRGLGLIAIYTKHRNLDRIAADVVQALTEEVGAAERVDEYVIEAGVLTVALLSKAHEMPNPPVNPVPESELPNRIVELFAARVTGLLELAALRAMGAVRADTHLLLRVFGPGVDAGYVANRMLLPRPDDAVDGARALLGNELSSMLDNVGLDDYLGLEAVSSWVEQKGVRPEAFRQTFRDPHPEDMFGAVTAVLADGERSDRAKEAQVKLSKSHPERHAVEMFTVDDADAEASNLRFAALMTTKTRYGHGAPALTLGTVVRAEDDRYWLCLQPACDSVRLDGLVPFPFAPLRTVDGIGECDLVVPFGEIARRFRLPNRIRDIRLFGFTAGETGRVLGVSPSADDTRWFFSGPDGQFEFLAELRDPAAQRVVQDLAGRMSRVGLDEPEWVRRSHAAQT